VDGQSLTTLNGGRVNVTRNSTSVLVDGTLVTVTDIMRRSFFLSLVLSLLF